MRLLPGREPGGPSEAFPGAHLFSSQRTLGVDMIDWRDIDPDMSFRNRTLDGIDFSGRILVGVDFSGCKLHECNFDGCDLSHANFENADLYRASFRDAVLYGVRLKQSNLTRCDFSSAYTYGFQVSDY